MYESELTLTSKDILEKEFSIDTRGYRPQEVDAFLDQVIRNYKIKDAIIDQLSEDKRNLASENLKSTDSDTTSSADVLRRLSNLEKIIYGKE